MKIAITGSPKSGKTTLSLKLSGRKKHTDELLYLDWKKQGDTALEWLYGNDYEIIEGVTVLRALRKWLKENNTGKPVDEVIFIHTPKTKLSQGQETMRRGLLTIWNQIKRELKSRNVKVTEIP